LEGTVSDPAVTDTAEIEGNKGHPKLEIDNMDIKIQANTNHDKNGSVEEDENQNKPNHEKLEQESRKIPQSDF
jgi:hypothetical protein